MFIPKKRPRKIIRLDVREISLVDKAANRKKFFLFKKDYNNKEEKEMADIKQENEIEELVLKEEDTEIVKQEEEFKKLNDKLDLILKEITKLKTDYGYGYQKPSYPYPEQKKAKEEEEETENKKEEFKKRLEEEFKSLFNDWQKNKK